MKRLVFARYDMAKQIITFFFVSHIVFSCNNPAREVESPRMISDQKVTSVDRNLEALKVEASRLRAGGSIKKIELKFDTANLLYVSNYKEYKEMNPHSLLAEKEVEAYWENGDAIKKALVDGSVRLMRKLSFSKSCQYSAPCGKSNL